MSQFIKKNAHTHNDKGKYTRGERADKGQQTGGKRIHLEPSEGDKRYVRRDENGSLSQSSKFVSRPAVIQEGGKRYVIEHGERYGQVVARRKLQLEDAAPRALFAHAVFSSEAEYDASVESVVARIKSGQVKARQPDLD